MSLNSIKSSISNRIMSTPNLPEVLGYLFFCGICALGAWIGSGHHPH